MIALPWQVVAAFIGLLGVQMVLGYLRRSECQERIDLAVREVTREARVDRQRDRSEYRDIYLAAMLDGHNDRKKKKERQNDC